MIISKTEKGWECYGVLLEKNCSQISVINCVKDYMRHSLEGWR